MGSDQKQTQLSSREREVLALICKGYTSKEIANHLYIAKGTVESHKRNLLFKMKSKNSVRLVIKAIQKGLVDINEV